MSLLVKGISKEEVRDAILTDGTKFPGANIDAKISTAGVKPTLLAEGTLTADGTEQQLVQEESTTPFKLSGVVDLSEMGTGDITDITLYIRAFAGEPYRAYHKLQYSGSQPDPMLHITSKLARHIRVTLKQLRGTLRNFDYSFYKEG